MINYEGTVKLKPYDQKEHDQTNTSYMLTIVLHEQLWNCMMCGDSIATVQDGIITYNRVT